MSVALPIPPRVDEIPGAVVSLLDVTSLRNLIGGSGRVVRLDQDLPDLSRTGFARVVVFLRDPVGTTYRDKANFVDVQIRVDVLRQSGLSPAPLLGRIHAEIFALLAGQSPSLTYADIVHPLDLKSRPTSALEASDRSFYFSSAVYRLAVAPV